MFIQVLQGHTSDAAGLQAQLEDWVGKHSEAAIGWLGTTAGVSAGNEFIAVVRFKDEASARSNSERVAQGRWWQETERLFDGPITFHDYAHTDLMLGGGSDEAGFVQIIQGEYTGDISPALPDEDAAALSKLRPELMGGSMGWDASGHFTQTVYFTSQKDARAGERAMGENADARAMMEAWQASITGVQYLDLRDPWLS